MDTDPIPSAKLDALLKLKRHEQPPPGYFAGFSAKVIARIESEEAKAGASWWRRFVRRCQTSPALTCAYGAMVASLMVFGIFSASNWNHPATAGNNGNTWPAGTAPLAVDAPAPPASLQMNTPALVIGNGTNPPGGLLASNSPFSLPQLQVAPAAYQPDAR